MNLQNHSTSLTSFLRRGMAMAALFVFLAAALTTWLASSAAQAAPRAEQPKAAAVEKQAPAAEDDTDADDTGTTSGPKLKKDGKVLSGKLNLNTASDEQLRMLPGIGPAKAQRIIDFRTKQGDFKRVRDLRRVKGFGYKTLQKLGPYLSVSGETTLKAE